METIAHYSSRTTLIRTLTLGISFSLCVDAIKPTSLKAINADYAAASALLLSACTLSYYKDKVAQHPKTLKLAENTNTDSQDIVDSTTLGLYYWAWSYLLPYPGWQFSYRYDTLANPLIQIASTSRTWNALLKRIPLLKQLACTNSDCQGICHECEFKHLIRKLPFEAVNASLREPLLRWHINSQVAKHNKAINAQNDQTQTAHEKKIADLNSNEQQKFIPYHVQAPDPSDPDCTICCNENVQHISLCPVDKRHTACSTCYLNILNTKPKCPSCNEPLIQPVIEKLPPAPKLIPTLDPDFYAENDVEATYSAVARIGITQPLWTFLRNKNLFPYRWGMALYRLNPLIARHTTCPNAECTSICNQCKLKKLSTPHGGMPYIGSILARLL